MSPSSSVHSPSHNAVLFEYLSISISIQIHVWGCRAFSPKELPITYPKGLTSHSFWQDVCLSKPSKPDKKSHFRQSFVKDSAVISLIVALRMGFRDEERPTVGHSGSLDNWGIVFASRDWCTALIFLFLLFVCTMHTPQHYCRYATLINNTHMSGSASSSSSPSLNPSVLYILFLLPLVLKNTTQSCIFIMRIRFELFLGGWWTASLSVCWDFTP